MMIEYDVLLITVAFRIYRATDSEWFRYHIKSSWFPEERDCNLRGANIWCTLCKYGVHRQICMGVRGANLWYTSIQIQIQKLFIAHTKNRIILTAVPHEIIWCKRVGRSKAYICLTRADNGSMGHGSMGRMGHQNWMGQMAGHCSLTHDPLQKINFLCKHMNHIMYFYAIIWKCYFSFHFVIFSTYYKINCIFFKCYTNFVIFSTVLYSTR